MEKLNNYSVGQFGRHAGGKRNKTTLAKFVSSLHGDLRSERRKKMMNNIHASCIRRTPRQMWRWHGDVEISVKTNPKKCALNAVVGRPAYKTKF